MNGDDSSAKKPGDDEQISENKRKHPWGQVCYLALHLVTLSPFWKVEREPASNIEAFDDIAQYFSKKEWEKLKYSEKITYVYMKRNYEAMSRLGFQVTLPLFMRNKQAEDSQEDDSDRDSNPGNLVERRTMTFGMFQGLFPQLVPREPPEEENYSEAVPETSGTQNDVKPLTSEKINKITGPKRAKHAWSHRLRERKNLVIYEEISDPEEDDE
uniref:KRAB-related domain-containing protein n=1 Tax=Cebus imitator TaxID=2715852 RepID=A0A2K5PQT6_CEBIM